MPGMGNSRKGSWTVYFELDAASIEPILACYAGRRVLESL
jgi:hypothetical protein